MMDVTLSKRADQLEELLQENAVHRSFELEQISYYSTQDFQEPSAIRQLPEEALEDCNVGFQWTRDREPDPDDRQSADASLLDGSHLPAELSIGTNVWFRLQFEIPDTMAGRPVYLRFIAKPLDERKWGPNWERPRVECQCYRNGEPWQAFDGGRDDLLLTDHASGGESYDLLVEAGTTVLWGGLDVENFRLEAASLYSTRPSVRELYHNVSVLNDLRKELDEESRNYRRILRALSDVARIVPSKPTDETAYHDAVEDALERLDDQKSSLTSDLTGHVLHTLGHAHIDLAWLWPWSETVRKGGRSFSNMLKLIEEYPEFKFVQSQPHLYQFVKDRYPAVYDAVDQRIDEDRWDPLGGLWVESDINISGGEALARQFLLGKRHFRSEFDVDPSVVFIPDVFGYSASLPGIANAADCEYFVTQKMSWNETNDFPHHTFKWKGIDGSELLTHFPPADTYDGRMKIDEIRRSAAEYEQNDLLDSSLYFVGWGDGGGGTNREMLERAQVVDDINSLPDIEFSSVEDFFEGIEAQTDELPTWRGELYLEKHRGTLTSQARTKKHNRRAEFALREAEMWASVALARQDGFTYPDEQLRDAWKILLFNQFHDILPGSSVREVYVDTERDYAELFNATSDVIDTARDALTASTGESRILSVTNSLSWTRSPLVTVDLESVPFTEAGNLAIETPDGERIPTQQVGDSESFLFEARELPEVGTKSFEVTSEPVPAENNLLANRRRLENGVLRVTFDEDGYLDSIVDKESDRELLDGPANELVRYDDQSMLYDAWDIEEDIYEHGTPLPAPEEVTVIEDGPLRATIRQTRSFGNSTIEQDISLRRDSKRLDFETTVDWHERHTLLKTHFPVAVNTGSATYETQFGHEQRPTHSNTSWDQARFEEAHQKWVDVSDSEIGMALLNDCKYGVHVDEAEMSLSLLRSPTSPDSEADQGHHTFTYSLRPHAGSAPSVEVLHDAYALNAPIDVVPVTDRNETSAMSIDTPGVILEALKQSEDDPDTIVVRLYEALGRPTTATIETGFDIDQATMVNLIEDEKQRLDHTNRSITLDFDAFEIQSIALTLQR